MSEPGNTAPEPPDTGTDPDPDLAPTAARAGPVAGPSGEPADRGRHRHRRGRLVRAGTAMTAGVGLLLVFGWSGDTGAVKAVSAQPARYAVLSAAVLGGGSLECGGIRFSPAALPGRSIGPGERAGPAEGIAQLLRLAEWSRHSPYDGAHWSVVQVSDRAAVLVAKAGRSTTYTPVHRRTDGHWEMDAPCQPRLVR